RLIGVGKGVGVDSFSCVQLPGLHRSEASVAPVSTARTGQMTEIPADRDVFTTSLKVRFYELDPYDHVNHTNYFSYFETARIEYLADMGWGLDVMKDQGWQLVVVEAHARF